MDNLLERAFLFLESGEFKKADEYLKKVLDADCKNPRAYLGKLMVERKVCKIEDLANCSKPLEKSKHYEMIMCFDENQKFKAEIRRYNEQIIERNNSLKSTYISKNQNSSGNNSLGINKRKKLKVIAICLWIAVVISSVFLVMIMVNPKNDKQPGNIPEENGNKVTMVDAGNSHIVGLREGGTVVAVGDNEYGQCDVADWKDIIQVSACDYQTIGLKADGTVETTKITDELYKRAKGHKQFSDWKDVVAVSAGEHDILGVKKDGTIIKTGEEHIFNIEKWSMT